MQIPTAILPLALLLIAAVPASQPATQPALPQDSPRAAFKSFLTALLGGQDQNIAPLCQAKDAPTQRVVADLTDIASAMKSLRVSAHARFKPPKFSQAQIDAIVPMMPLPQDVDFADQRIERNSGVVDGGDLFGPAWMTRTSGIWKLDMFAVVQNEEFGPNPHDYFADLAKAIRHTAADIDSGKLDSPELARQVLQFRQSVIGDTGPTTLPSELPSQLPSKPPSTQPSAADSNGASNAASH